MRAHFDEQRIRHRKLVWTSLLRASLQTRRRSCYSLITQPIHQFLFIACFYQSHHDKRSSSCSQQFYAERKCNRSTCKRNTHIQVEGHAIRNVSCCPSIIDVRAPKMSTFLDFRQGCHWTLQCDAGLIGDMAKLEPRN